MSIIIVSSLLILKWDLNTSILKESSFAQMHDGDGPADGQAHLNYLCTAQQTPALKSKLQENIDEGKSPVVQVVWSKFNAGDPDSHSPHRDPLNNGMGIETDVVKEKSVDTFTLHQITLVYRIMD